MNSTNNETHSIRQLSSDELESVGGGVVWIPIAIAGGTLALGTYAYFSQKAERSGKDKAIRDNASFPCR